MGNPRSVTWVLETEIFADSHRALREAVERAGHRVVVWRDEWWSGRNWPAIGDGPVVFHGSLGNAARICGETPWRPGAWCNTSAFHCSAWYPRAREWLLHERWLVTSAATLVADVNKALEPLGCPDKIFVRPDSPLKPFSGRVLARSSISLRALDHGFYYDDATLPVVIAPVRTVAREWRYVVVGRRVVAGSAYAADGRSALPDDPGGPPWAFASDVAARVEPPEEVYVLDVCESEGALRVLELNPFSGADLYACDRAVVVEAVSSAAAVCLP